MSVTLVTGTVWSELRAAAGRRGRKYAAVAFIGVDGAALLSEFGEGDVLVCNAGVVALRAGSTHPGALRALIKRGVEVYTHDRLHAKVYVFGGCAVVGSANASASSVAHLEEATVQISDRDIVAKARRFVLRMRKAALPVNAKYLELADQEYRAPRGGGGRRHGTNGVTPPVRLMVTECDQEEPTGRVAAHWRANNEQWQARAGAEWSLDIVWGPTPRWTLDNWVICVCTNVDPYTVSPPMKVLGLTQVGGRANETMTWFRKPAHKDVRPWEHLVGKVLVDTHYRLKLEKPVTSAAAVDAIFKAWKLSPDD